MNREMIEGMMRSALDENGHLSCEAAHEIASKSESTPEEVGKRATDLGIQITRCQLGFFGYAPEKGMPGYKIVHKLDTLPEPVSAEVKNAAAEGKVSCREVWRIAEKHNVKRPDMGDIVETLGIKVTPCQLGCF